MCSVPACSRSSSSTSRISRVFQGRAARPRSTTQRSLGRRIAPHREALEPLPQAIDDGDLVELAGDHLGQVGGPLLEGPDRRPERVRDGQGRHRRPDRGRVKTVLPTRRQSDERKEQHMTRKLIVGVLAAALLMSGALVGVSFGGGGGITQPEVIELSLDLCGDSCRVFELRDPAFGKRGNGIDHVVRRPAPRRGRQRGRVSERTLHGLGWTVEGPPGSAPFS